MDRVISRKVWFSETKMLRFENFQIVKVLKMMWKNLLNLEILRKFQIFLKDRFR